MMIRAVDSDIDAEWGSFPVIISGQDKGHLISSFRDTMQNVHPLAKDSCEDRSIWTTTHVTKRFSG